MPSKFSYGGQAVIEGVMIRGRRFFSVAVRKPNQEIAATAFPLSSLYTGGVRKVPLIRGVLVLAEMLMLGMRALNYSASAAMEQGDEKAPSSWAMGIMIGVSLVLGVGLFFVLPLFIVHRLDVYFASSIVSNLVEGVIRLGVLIGYIVVIGLAKDIRRVFAYHGAEHMTIHAYEAGDPLDVASVRKYSTAHPRCGTAFLLTVAVVAVLVFAFLGRPPLEWRIASRVVLVPVIAALSYEIIRFSGAHARNVLVRLMAYPSLALQSLTTRQPDDSQIEVAISAMKTALAADGEEAPGTLKSGPSRTEGTSSAVQAP